MKREFLRKAGSLLMVAILMALAVTAAFALDPKGRPKGMGPNAPGGYYIWQDDRGWHIRATSGSQKRHFTGEIISEGGSITALKEYREEQAGWFKQQGNKVNIDLTTEKNIEGLDFQADGNLTFRLTIDDREEPTGIHIGANGDNPSGIPFTLSGR